MARAVSGLSGEQNEVVLTGASFASHLPVSAVVCNRDRASSLERCLASLQRNLPAEIIVVDGLSRDQSVEVAKSYGAAVISDGGRGLGHARRVGVLAATQPYVFFIDTDVHLPGDGVLSALLGEAVTAGFAGLHAQVVADKVAGYWEWAQDMHFRLTFNRPGRRKAIGCIAALFSREPLLAHLPDEFFSGASEDGDLSRRLRESGYKLGVAHSHVYHSHRATFTAFVRQRLWYGRGNGRLAWRHHSPGTLLAPILFLVGGTYLAIRHGVPKLVPYIVAHSACVLSGGIAEYARLIVQGAGATE